MDDDNLQLSNIRVIEFTDTDEFGLDAANAISIDSSTRERTINLASGQTAITTWDPIGFELKPKEGIATLTDIDPLRQGTQANIYVETKSSNLTNSDINSYIKFVSKERIALSQTSGETLRDLDGSPILQEGWYDFTQRRDNTGALTGDGANLLFNDQGVLQSINITLTDNQFGDGNPTSMELSDPGALALQTGSEDIFILLDTSNSTQFSSDASRQSKRIKTHKNMKAIALRAAINQLEQSGYSLIPKIKDNGIQINNIEDLLDKPAKFKKSLKNYELINQSNSNTSTSELNAHLITYDYVARHKSWKIEPGKRSGLSLLKKIADSKTPFQRFGNSTNNNQEWEKLDLPKPSQLDLFQANKKMPSNLYAGTEMLGALEGLEFLLNKKASNSNRQNQSTTITMVVSGTPERRSWWDSRTNATSDSIIGQRIPLPKSLGQENITTSGLLYDNEGNPHYFKNNKGQRQWKRMQKDLNTALDRLADQSTNPTSDVNVNLYGLNDTSNSSLAKIYQNLFDEQIFNNSASNWSYSHQTIQGLQDLNL